MASIVVQEDKHALINSVTELALPTRNQHAIMGASMIVAAISRGLSDRLRLRTLLKLLSYGHRALYKNWYTNAYA